MSIGIVLALMAAVGYGAADFVGGLTARRVSPWAVALAGQLAGGLAMLVAGSALPGQARPEHFAWAVLAGAGSAVGTVFLYRGLARGRMGVVAPVSGVGAALVPVFVGVSLGERPAVLTWVGVLVALPGIYLVSREVADGTGRSWGGIADGALAGLGFGLLFVALAQVPESAGLLPLAANQGVGAVFTLAVAGLLSQPWAPRDRAGFRAAGWGAVGGLLGTAGTAAFLFASHSADLAVVGVLASLYPAVTVLLATTVLREPFRLSQGLGLLVCGASVGLVAMA
ncbi:DMT family transporter [Pseudonocardia humida]|uniref:DMT family transporter n=1 Tax=Pseudonocardia humida TaxID=2800819 RepID=A0ABT1A3R4_9PSEU|nr:DMT family transporter [Pseudonocardia humida]MCO1657623.1 DMT family transporter [Pseudonocardia humida]